MLTPRKQQVIKDKQRMLGIVGQSCWRLGPAWDILASPRDRDDVVTDNQWSVLKLMETITQGSPTHLRLTSCVMKCSYIIRCVEGCFGALNDNVSVHLEGRFTEQIIQTVFLMQSQSSWKN